MLYQRRGQLVALLMLMLTLQQQVQRNSSWR